MPNLRYLAEQQDDIGRTLYVVDSDFRTAAQGWTTSDGTGPLDLVNQRSPGTVFYTPGGLATYAYATDAAALQAAVDTAVDFRGDKILYTPGSYAIGTAVSLNVPGLRLLGPKTGHPKHQRVTVTATVASAYSLTAAADDMEIGYHTIVPLTAAKFMDVTAAANRGYLHHLFYNATGVAASTSTEFCNAAAADDWLIEQCSFYVDAAQGDAFTLASPLRWVWQDCDFSVGITAIAWASVFTFATSALGLIMRRCNFNSAGGATPAVYTNVVTGIANVNCQLFVHDCRVNGTAVSGTAGTGFETTFGTTTDLEYAENYYSGDATTEGGVLMVQA
jgi:hypothetical protein